MRSFDLRAEEQREREACELVLGFFDRLGSADLFGARALTGDRFRWFGREVTFDGAIGSFVGETAMLASNARVVPRPLLAEMATDADRILDGAIGEDAILVLVDVSRGVEATCAVIVDRSSGRPRIDRVFDPGAVREFLGKLGG